jgi:hypothetical protein
MKDLPLPEPHEVSPTPADLQEAQNRVLARSALVALAAERGYLSVRVRRFVFAALRLPDGMVGQYTRELEDSGRFRYMSSAGLIPAAGAFPETEFEHQVRTTLVAPALEHFDDLNDIAIEADAVLSVEARRIVGL